MSEPTESQIREVVAFDATLPYPEKSYERHVLFKCPECGGKHFGRDTEGSPAQVLKTVKCHDEFKRGCKWAGEWPQPKA